MTPKLMPRCGIAFCFFTIFTCTSVFSEQVYTNQVSAFEDKSSAYQFLEQLPDEMSPVWVYFDKESSYPWRVNVGHFEYFADAWTTTYHFDSEIIQEAIVKKIDVGEIKANNLLLDYPITSVGFGSDSLSIIPNTKQLPLDSMKSTATLLGLAGIDDSSSPSLLRSDTPEGLLLSSAFQSNNSSVRLSNFDQIITAHSDKPEAFVAKCGKALGLMRSGDLEQAENFLNAMKQSSDHEEKCFAVYLGGYLDIRNDKQEDAIQKFDMVRKDSQAAREVRNDAEIRYAYLVLKDQGFEAAATIFRELCNNKNLTPEQRLSAMERYEGIAQTREKYATAWMVNNLIEKYSTDKDQISSARMRRVGFAMEMSQRGLGTMEEVTRLSEELRQDPDVPESVQATNGLMHAESLFHRNKYSEALTAAQKLIEKYPHIHRECMMAEVLEAACLVNLDQHETAQTKLRALANRAEQAGEKKFYRSDPRASALVWLAYSHSNNGDSTKSSETLQELENKFSSTFDKQNAKKIFKDHPVFKPSQENRRE